MIDPDQAAVYIAEGDVRAAFDWAATQPAGDRGVTVHTTTVQLPREHTFDSLEACGAYVARVCDAELLPRADVFSKAGDDTAHYMLGSIHLPPRERGRWAYRALVLLHEIAHHAVITEYGVDRVIGHGLEFRRAMIALVRRHMGAETALVLRAAYTQQGVQI